MERLLEGKLNACATIFKSLQAELASISPALLPIHTRLVAIKKELESLISRNSPHAFSLTEVQMLQDEVREIEAVRIDGAFFWYELMMILILNLQCFEDIYELLASRDSITSTNPLREIYEKLVRLKSRLESACCFAHFDDAQRCALHVRKGLTELLKWGVSLSPRELLMYQVRLANFDNLRKDGIFHAPPGSDEEDEEEVPEGQGLLHGMLNECYDFLGELQEEAYGEGEGEDEEHIEEEELIMDTTTSAQLFKRLTEAMDAVDFDPSSPKVLFLKEMLEKEREREREREEKKREMEERERMRSHEFRSDDTVSTSSSGSTKSKKRSNSDNGDSRKAFRARVVERDGTCVITGSLASSCEACHIVPVEFARNQQGHWRRFYASNCLNTKHGIMDIRNGLLLRSSFHKHFDNYQFTIYLQEDGSYLFRSLHDPADPEIQHYNNTIIKFKGDKSTWPAPEFLQYHNIEFEERREAKLKASAGPQDLPEADSWQTLHQDMPTSGVDTWVTTQVEYVHQYEDVEPVADVRQ
ncbi:hypothetical protein HDV05_008779 [Chytridiales sp. JEL 0842]|nr:hypothetical protein HDV05_008779 [Chytridiales sp. JEL 0842]